MLRYWHLYNLRYIRKVQSNLATVNPNETVIAVIAITVVLG
nr:MAG TPA: hypothetical protein [Caudoviricetes sp.]